MVWKARLGLPLKERPPAQEVEVVKGGWEKYVRYVGRQAEEGKARVASPVLFSIASSYCPPSDQCASLPLGLCISALWPPVV